MELFKHTLFPRGKSSSASGQNISWSINKSWWSLSLTPHLQRYLSLSLSLDRRLLFPFLAEEHVCSWRWMIICLKLLFPSRIPLEWASVWGSEDALLFIDWSEPVSSGSIHHCNRLLNRRRRKFSFKPTRDSSHVCLMCVSRSLFVCRWSIGCFLRVLTRQSRPQRWVCSGFWDLFDLWTNVGVCFHFERGKSYFIFWLSPH